jgi:phosphodiesterase/alkaline phosphatase D-like protein
MNRPHLIIGHTASDHARIWVRGSAEYPVAFLTHHSEGSAGMAEQSLALEARHGYTGVIELTGLTPATRYQCEVSFGKNLSDPPAVRIYPSHNLGTFQTAPPEGAEAEVCFLLWSCNLHSLGIFSSPDPAFERVGELILEQGVNFTIQCGDQIYADVPPLPSGIFDEARYRSKYVDAWGDSEPTATVLRMAPHYMILDDHEIINDFANDMDLWASWGSVESLKIFSLKVYREFQHIHNPQTYGIDALYYNFSYGNNRFFVMDARTERYIQEPYNQMISAQQLQRFFEWLAQYPDDVKFVVTSVPFASEVRDRKDKWCSPPFLPQREQIIDFIALNNIRNVIFLTGDMHNAYHATMTLTPPGGPEVTIHELMSSPINQIFKSSLAQYQLDKRATKTKRGKVSYRSNIDLDTFYNQHSNVMCIRAGGGQVKYDIYRTKRTRGSEYTSTFRLV